jgi:hypothetical protein
MEKITLSRTDGRRPLSFEGELLAEVKDRWVSGREHTRWHELRAYRTASGRYVLEVEYVTQWQGEQGSCRAEVYDTMEALVEAVERLEDAPPRLQSLLLEAIGAEESV